ncbi:MAG TPA: bifunctional phosphopantothenoylcysteine decarboxylase/phosphopantothenate--cysteine ligase CoaBC [Terriglobia bacterium]|nr:bifunctional phosphopantothenoylcysteine decarboxylase/phosphopantothenate--cysteine ligase CoaBC [Terriglobia bacterium]
MRVALGVSGGIAAYKSAELVRLLQDRGLEVQVVMTAAAREFVSPLTFAGLTGHKVITGLFAPASGEANLESAIEHIALAQSIDALIIAPATANVLAKIAHGLADDFLTTLALATRAPLIVAPAMNVNMWENPATRGNLDVLKARGVRLVDAEEGYLACGMVGAGRLASLESIVAAVCAALGLADDLNGESVLVTAGPTEEPIDPVRHLSNRSSGKMGYAVAEAARRRGAKVILVSGPTRLEPPPGVVLRRVRTAEQMAGAVFEELPEASIVVMTAAVADFRAARVESGKLKRSAGTRTLELEPTQDIIAEVARRRRPNQFVVGFAAETEHVVEHARAKLRMKHIDLLVANDVTAEGAGFEVDTNIVTLIFADGRARPLERMAKLQVAGCVLDEVVALRKGQKAAQSA